MTSRAALASENDDDWGPIKRHKRKRYLYLVMREYIDRNPSLALFKDPAYNLADEGDPLVDKWVELVLTAYERLRLRIRNKVPHANSGLSNIDIHKIIAGTEAAVILALPVRMGNTRSLSPDLARTNKEVLLANANLALYIGLDMLYQWKGVKPEGFLQRPTLRNSHRIHLCNTLPAGSRERFFERFPIFWCSQLWYAIEEILSLEMKLSKL